MSNMADNADTTDYAALLRAVRARLDLTQEQVADRLGVSFASVNRWEGAVNTPQKAARAAIASLAAEAGVDADRLAAGPAEAAALVTRRRRAGRARRAAPPSTKPMEQMLWDAACSIRGEKDAAKFKDYLLPLLFLKRLSDVFDDELERLAEEYGDREIAREIAEADHELLRFYLPPEARWGVIAGRVDHAWPRDDRGRSTRPRDVGEHLTRAVRAVVRHNPPLAGVIDLVDFAAERNGERELNPARLAAVVETFSDPRYRLGLADVQPDFLGRAYEYLLRKFAEGSGQSAGEFFTPTEVGLLMAHLMRPRPGEACHDYACGSAGLLVKLQLAARERDPTSRVPLRLCGQELQAESYAVAQMNAIIHDMEVEIARGDTMLNPKFKTPAGRIAAYDIVVANPMWNQPFSADLLANDPFDRFRGAGGITSGKGDWAWLQHTLACLNERGRAAVVLDTGAVTRGSGSKHEDRERAIRKWFVDRDLIDGVILLPDNLFYNTSAAGVIVVLAKRKPAARKDRIVLVNAGRRVRKGRPKNFIPAEDIRPLAERFVQGAPIEGEVAVITREQAEQADYNLSPARWVQPSAVREDADLKTIIDRFNAIIAEEASISRDLEAVLTKLRDLVQRRGSMSEPTRLAELCDLVATQVDPRDRPNQQYVGLEHVASGRFVRDGQGTADDVRSAKYAFRPGDVLYGKLRPYLDKAVLASDAGICTTELLVLRPKEGVDPRFVVGAVHAPGFVQHAVAGMTGVQHPRTSWRHVGDFELPRFTSEERERIAIVISAIDRKADLSRRKSAVLDALLKSLLDKLMTGDIQVSDLDVPND